ncbi:MAG: hypothetical protein ABIL06_14285 [Pseudomonadota bacterium]
MIKKKILVPNRIRRIEGGFSFIPHRFLTDGFLASLGQTEILRPSGNTDMKSRCCLYARGYKGTLLLC